MIRMIIKERTFVDSSGKTKSRFGSRNGKKIEWIIVHYTGDYGSQGCARKTAEAMQSWKRTCSTHYLVGDDETYQVVEDRKAAWHCPYADGNKCLASNTCAIGVDLVEHKKSTKTRSVSDTDWYFTEKVVEDGAELIAMLADKYDISTEHIVRHFDVTGKWCPRPFVGNDLNAVMGRRGNDMWQEFLERIKQFRDKREEIK